MTRRSAHHRRHTVSAVGTAAVALLGLGIGAAAPLLTSPVAHADTWQSPGLNPGKTLSGVVMAGGASASKSFGDWRHKPVDVINAYAGTFNWGNFSTSSAAGLPGYWAGLNAHHVWSVPLIPADGHSTIDAAASGAYDDHYASFARGLVQAGDGNATIRLGWEMNGNWFAWNGLKNPSAWAGGFRHAVTAMRSVSGQHFTFDWTVATDHVDATPFYPGDAYVDIIGADQYDVAWNMPGWDHAKAWQFDLTAHSGLNWAANFASSHGKRLSLSEWGMNYRCDGHAGGDDPYFIDQMRSWIDSHDVAYETYFNSDDNNCNRFKLTSGTFPNGANEYVKKWSGASNTVTNPVKPPPPGANPPPTPPGGGGTGGGTGGTAPGVGTAPGGTTTPAPAPATSVTTPARPAAPSSGLLVSFKQDRSASIALAQAKVDKPAYIYYVPTDAVRLVVFSLDGKPYRAESSRAYDLVGTTDKGARPISPRRLKAGQHTISVQVTLESGGRLNDAATFTVPTWAAKTLTTRFLRLSSAARGHGTVRLDKAVVRGTSYLVLPKIKGQIRATYRLDGKLIRWAKPDAKGTIWGKTMLLPDVSKGLHQLVLRMTSKSGKVRVIVARFRVA